MKRTVPTPSPKDNIITTRHGQPFASGYDDIYYSIADGRAESEHVFVNGNNLAERFAALQPGQQFHIGELGFGTGLNFYTAWQCFNAHAPAGAILRLTSIERYPLTLEQWRSSLLRWPELDALRQKVQPLYKPQPGGVTLWRPAGNVSLKIYWQDVAEALKKWQTPCDAWFLDGFNPATNPAMWAPEVMTEVFRLCRPGGSVATFAVARLVKESLKSAGFTLAKKPGYGTKREMLVATKPRPPAVPTKGN